jgi:negative regulator of sigma E activity
VNDDDDLTELILRASAYLDGELDAGERALAEADPAVMAEVEALRSLQDEIRDVEPPRADTREAAITAALAEFDALQPATAPAAAAGPGAGRVVPFRPRPSYTRWLTAAAAVVAVGLVGVVVAQSNRGGDDKDSAAIEGDLAEAPSAARSDTAAADAEIQSSVTESDLMAAEMATAEAGGDVAEATTEAPAVMESAPAAGPDEEGDVPPSSEVTTFSTVEPIDTPQTTAPRTLDDPVTEETLFAIGRDLLAQFEAGTLTTPETACEFGNYVILARVGFVVGTEEREAIIAADPDFPEVGAFDAATCLDFAIVTGE